MGFQMAGVKKAGSGLHGVSSAVCTTATRSFLNLCVKQMNSVSQTQVNMLLRFSPPPPPPAFCFLSTPLPNITWIYYCSLCKAAGSALARVSVCVRLWGRQGGNGLATCRDLRQVNAWLAEIMEWHGLIWLRADQLFVCVCVFESSPSSCLPPPMCVFLCLHSFNLWKMKCPAARVA